METYPIVIDGALEGKLSVDRQGARTVFDAECRMLPGLVRLSVYGGGREGYLGVLAPEDGKLRLHRVLSRNQMGGFPAEIESAEPAGLDRGMAQPKAESAVPEQERGSPHGDAPERETAPASNSEPEQTVGTAHGAAPEDEPAAMEPREAPQAAEQPEEDALSWYSSPDGALVCFDGARSLIALPAGDKRIPADIPGEPRTVEGRKYLVYRTKDGRIVR